jgi:hypothetical protein
MDNEMRELMAKYVALQQSSVPVERFAEVEREIEALKHDIARSVQRETETLNRCIAAEDKLDRIREYAKAHAAIESDVLLKMLEPPK